MFLVVLCFVGGSVRFFPVDQRLFFTDHAFLFIGLVFSVGQDLWTGMFFVDRFSCGPGSFLWTGIFC